MTDTITDAARDLDAILGDMAASGSDPRRAARRIRKLVDTMLLSAVVTGERPADLPIAVTVDVPPVTTNQATFLTIYHLGLAAAYYESAGPELELELARARGAADPQPALCLEADRAWIRAQAKAYDNMNGGEDS